MRLCALLCNDAPPMEAFDAPDRVILDLLRRDGRATVAEMASATGLSASACSRRLRRLEDQRVIRGYRAIIDPKADGRGPQRKTGEQGTRQQLGERREEDLIRTGSGQRHSVGSARMEPREAQSCVWP